MSPAGGPARAPAASRTAARAGIHPFISFLRAREPRPARLAINLTFPSRSATSKTTSSVPRRSFRRGSLAHEALRELSRSRSRPRPRRGPSGRRDTSRRGAGRRSPRAWASTDAGAGALGGRPLPARRRRRRRGGRHEVPVEAGAPPRLLLRLETLPALGHRRVAPLEGVEAVALGGDVEGDGGQPPDHLLDVLAGLDRGPRRRAVQEGVELGCPNGGSPLPGPRAPAPRPWKYSKRPKALRSPTGGPDLTSTPTDPPSPSTLHGLDPLWPRRGLEARSGYTAGRPSRRSCAGRSRRGGR